MAGKISDLTEITSVATGDFVEVLDVSDTTMGSSGSNKKATVANLTALKAAAGANSDITSLSALSTPLSVAQGGTGAATLTGLVKGSGTSAMTAVSAPSGAIVGDTDSQTLTNKTLTSPTLTTPTLGVATATSINKVTITAPASSATLTIANGKTLTASDTTTIATNAITMGGGEVVTFSASNALSLLTTGTSVMTFPTATDTVAVLGTAQTFTATQTEKQIVWTNNAIAASSNAATVPITHRLNTVTNSSAATLTITMTTTSAVDGQLVIVRVLDFSGVAQTITWVNTENSSVSVPVTSNGSTTLFLTVGFIYNGATSKWRCIASA